MSADHPTRTTAGRARGALLWVAAALVMLVAAGYQRRTGPTYPMKGELELAGQTLSYELPRGAETTAPAEVALPAPAAASGRLISRRYPSGDEFTAQPLARDGGRLIGRLPLQPAAGKVEYYLELEAAAEVRRLPSQGALVLRYKGPVPTAVLLPHVLVMFLAMLVGVRAGLGALLLPRGLTGLARLTLAGITLGGLVLGPLVQKHAFGAYWTGFPNGYDLTDNKTLIMWLAWLAALVVLGRRPLDPRWGRSAVLAAMLVTIAVYLIPHSLRGSELDYGAVDRGVAAGEAIGNG